MSNAVKVGVFVAACLAVLGYLILAVEDLELFGGPKQSVEAELDTVVGLDLRAPVRVAGVRVGKVGEIRLDGLRARVRVDFDAEVPLREGAHVAIASAGLLGDTYLNLFPGPQGAPPLPEGTVLPGTAPPTFDEALAKLSDLGDSLSALTGPLAEGDTGASLGRLISNLEETSASIRDLVDANRAQVDGTMRNFERFSATLADELPKLTAQLERTLSQVESVVAENRGDLSGSLANVRELTEKVKVSVDNLNEVTSKIARGEGSLGKLLSSDQAHDQLVSALSSVETGVGTLTDTLGRVGKIQLELGMEGSYFTDLEESRSEVALDLQATNPDRFYHLALVDSPLGKRDDKTETITVTNPDGSVETTVVETSTRDDSFTISAQFGFRLGDASARLGLFESSGGGAIDYDLLDRRLRFSIEAFDFSRADDDPHLRILGRFLFHPNLYLVGGYDDFLVDDNASLFLGAGIRWRDDDLKYLLGSLPRF